MTEPSYNYADAARKLGASEHWLRRRIKDLPHRKIGQTVSFTDAHIAAIAAAHEVVPAKYQGHGDLVPITRRRRTS